MPLKNLYIAAHRKIGPFTESIGAGMRYIDMPDNIAHNFAYAGFSRLC